MRKGIILRKVSAGEEEEEEEDHGPVPTMWKNKKRCCEPSPSAEGSQRLVGTDDEDKVNGEDGDGPFGDSFDDHECSCIEGDCFRRKRRRLR